MKKYLLITVALIATFGCSKEILSEQPVGDINLKPTPLMEKSSERLMNLSHFSIWTIRGWKKSKNSTKRATSTMR